MNEKVRHRRMPADPHARANEHGRITRTPEGNLRVTPQDRQIPAQAYVSWADGE